MFQLRLAFLLVGFVTACTSLSGQECQNADWFALGQADGMLGAGDARLSEHQKTCRAVGVTPDGTKWAQGYARGLAVYCTAASAYKVGRKGRALAAVCSAPQTAGMQPGYEHGLRYFKISHEIIALEQQIISARGDMAEAQTSTSNLAGAEAVFAEAEIAELNQRIKRLKQQRQKYAVWP